MTLVDVYPIGVIRMIDSGSMDEKILSIPFSDPMYNSYKSVFDLPEHVFDEIKHFFTVYKQLEHKETIVNELLDCDRAKEIISDCIRMYNEKFGK